MPHTTPGLCVVAQSPRAQQIAGITDDAERLTTAQQFLTNGRLTLREVQAIRDETIRHLRAAGMTRKAIADLGVPESVVVDALRSRS